MPVVKTNKPVPVNQFNGVLIHLRVMEADEFTDASKVIEMFN
jgi:hypothetical protein